MPVEKPAKRSIQNLNIDNLKVGNTYSKRDIASLGKVPKLVNNQEWVGIVEFKNCILLFVDLDKSLKKSTHKYRDEFKTDEFHWDSQNRNHNGSPIINRLSAKNHNDPILLFARVRDKKAGKTLPFVYCGRLDYKKHFGERPVRFHWKMSQHPNGLGGTPELDELAAWSPNADRKAQKTYLYIWNPDRWPWDDFEDAVKRVKSKKDFEMPWSCGNTTRKKISAGDMFFLMRLGIDPKGIIGGGYILSEPYYFRHWDPVKAMDDKEALRTDLHFTFLSSRPIVKLDFLQRKYPNFTWASQKGGIEIPSDISEEVLNKIKKGSRQRFEHLKTQTVRIKSEATIPSLAVQQGYGLTSPERKAVELHAMNTTRRYLESQGYSVKDTSSRYSFDFLATKDGCGIKVEVKGTTSPRIESVIMTANEVELHTEQSGKTALAIVSNISLTRGDKPKCENGELEYFDKWDIKTWKKKPTQYQVIRPKKNASK